MSVLRQLERQKEERAAHVAGLLGEPAARQFLESADDQQRQRYMDELHASLAKEGPFRAITLLEQRPLVREVMSSDAFNIDEKEQLISTWMENVDAKADPSLGDRFRTNLSDSFYGIDNVGMVTGAVIDKYKAGASSAAGVAYEENRARTIEQELQARQQQPFTRDESGNIIAWGTNHPDFRSFDNDRLQQELRESRERFDRYAKQLKERRFSATKEFLTRDAQLAGMPEWEGAMEGIAALAGQLAGAVPTPENLVPVPGGPVAGGVGRRMAVNAGKQALMNAGLNVATEPLVQGAAIEKGTQEEYSLKDAAVRTSLGATIGAGGGALRGAVQRPLAAGAARAPESTAAPAAKAVGEAAEAAGPPPPKSGRPVTIAARQVAAEAGDPPPPRSARELMDDALASGEPLDPDQVAKLPKVEQNFLAEFPELATADGLAKLRERTRGVVSDDSAIETARRLGWTEQDVLRIQPGTALNAEQKLAMRGVVQSNTRLLKLRQQKLREAGIPVDSPEYRMRSVEIAQSVNDNMRLHQVERGVASEAGRALRAHQLQVDDYDAALAKASSYLSDPSIRPEAKAALTRIIADMDPANPRELTEAMRHIKDSSGMEKFVEFATAVKLMGKQTFFVNILSSISRQVMMPFERIVFAAMDAPNALKKGGRNTFFAEALGEAVGQMKGYRDVAANVARLIKDEEWAMRLRTTSDFMGSKPAAIRGRFGMDTWYDKFMDAAGTLVRLPYRGLGVGDILVRLPAENGAAYRMAYRAAIKEGHKPGTSAFSESVRKFLVAPKSDQVRDIMKNTAERALFQRDPKNKFLKDVGTLRAQHPSMKLIIPFYRTINDLIKTAAEYSPAAAVSRGVREDLAAGGAARSEALGRMTIGTAAMFPLLDIARRGEITLGPPKDPHERDRWMRDHQPYSVKVGDKWVAYNRIAPYSYLFSTAALIGESLEKSEEDTSNSLMADLIFGNARTLADQSFVTGVSDLLDAIQDPDRKAERFINQFIVGATYPNILAEEARARDPVIRDTANPEGMAVQRAAAAVGVGDEPVVAWLANLEAAYRQRIPELSKTLPARTDLWGQEIRRSSPAESEIGKYWEQSLNPIRVFTPQKLIVDRELDAIGYKPTLPSRKVQGYELSPNQYRVYKETTGRLAYTMLDSVVQTERWQQAAPRTREMLADKVMRESREVARNLIAVDAIVKSRLAQGFMQQGMVRKDAMARADEVAGERMAEYVAEGVDRMRAQLRGMVEQD